MNIDEVRKLTDEALASREKTLGEELFKLRFQHGIRPLENTASLRRLKKDIARVKTVINEQAKEQ